MKNIERIDDSTVKIDGVVYAKQAERGYKVGDWLAWIGYDKQEAPFPIRRIERIDSDGTPWNSDGAFAIFSYRPATDKEIEAHLISEAEKKGFKDGVKFKGLRFDRTAILKDWQVDDRRSNDPEYAGYYRKNDILNVYDSLNGVWEVIYKDGKWAEIIKAEFPKTREELFSFLLDYNDSNMSVIDFLNSEGF